MAPSMADADAMVEACESNGVFSQPDWVLTGGGHDSGRQAST